MHIKCMLLVEKFSTHTGTTCNKIKQRVNRRVS
nr:MAG TPA: GCS1 Male gamete fusion factor [Caudoviricetes sp.]